MTQSIREVAPARKWAVAELWTYIGCFEKGFLQIGRRRRISYLPLLV
jgi:hypothetical protein